MGASAYFRNNILNHMLRGQAFTPPAAVYISLHTGEPDEQGSNEVTGGGYKRQPVRFGNAASGMIENTTEVEWRVLLQATIAHVGLWDAAAAGHLLWSGAQSPPRALLGGDSYRIPAFALQIEIN